MYLLAALVTLTFAGTARASGQPGFVIVCYSPVTGAIAVSKSHSHCSTKERSARLATASNPGLVGPRGPAGKVGKQGPEGIEGAAGPAGPAGATGATGSAGADATSSGTAAFAAITVSGATALTGSLTANGGISETGATSLTADAATTVPLTVTGAASQSHDFFDVTANGGTAGGVFKISSGGNITASGTLTGLTGLTVASGGETITAGGLAVTAGGISIGSGSFKQHVVTVTSSGGAATFDATAGNVFTITMTEPVTATFTDPATVPGEVIVIIINNDADADQLTFPATVALAGNTAYTASTSAPDVFTFVSDGSKWLEISQSLSDGVTQPP